MTGGLLRKKSVPVYGQGVFVCLFLCDAYVGNLCHGAMSFEVLDMLIGEPVWF